MIEETVVRMAAPTLAGIKTGSLFPCPYEDRSGLLSEMRRLNGLLSARGLCLIPLRWTDSTALLYLFRISDLKKDLQNSAACELLCQAGYPCESCRDCLRHLLKRFRSGGEFPHEVGLFLSYPPEDVRGFINDRRNFKASCIWKVYGDEVRARALCARYQKCTECYCRLWRSGWSLDRLAVAG